MKDAYISKKLVFSLGLILVFIFASLVTAKENLPELVKKIQPAVVTIITYDKDKRVLGQGSGFFVDRKGYLITNYHVLKGAYSAEVKTCDRKRYPITFIVAENETVDLIKVLVDIPEKSHKWIKVTERIPAIAEHVLVVGSPMGLEQTVTEGIVSAVREAPSVGKGEVYQISAPISPGSSGSPVVNMKGQVIGVATFGLVEGQNLNFAVPGKYVLDLKQENNGKAISEWAYGISKEKLEMVEKLNGKSISLSTILGQPKKAIPLLKEFVEEDPNNARSWFHLGYCYDDLGKTKDSIEAYRQVFRIKPDFDFGQAYFILGGFGVKLGLYTEAIKPLKCAIRKKPNFAWAYYYLGLAYGKLGYHKKALEVLEQAIRIEPNVAEFHHYLGFAYANLHLFNDAIKAFKQAIRIEPDYAEAYLSLGVSYVAVGNIDSALEQYTILESLDRDKADELVNIIHR